jgi:hypothetical protein
VGRASSIKRGKTTLKKSVIDWLLEENQPSIRYLALTELLDRSKKDPEVKSAMKSITKIGWVKDILEKQTPGGYWIDEKNLYFPKYISTNWMLLVLSDLGLTRENPRIERACQLWMNRFRMKDGGFNDEPRDKVGHLCLTGNTVRALVKFGYVNDPVVRRAFEWLVKYQTESGGWDCFLGKGNLDSWEPLSAFAVYPRQKWTRSMKLAVEKGAEFYLERELHKEGKHYAPWYRFHYPVHYYYDLLVALDFMTALGYSSDKRLGFAVSLLKKKRRRDGRWNLDAVNPDPESPVAKWDRKHPKLASIPFALESPRKPSKMITLNAMKVLNRIAGS